MNKTLGYSVEVRSKRTKNGWVIVHPSTHVFSRKRAITICDNLVSSMRIGTIKAYDKARVVRVWSEVVYEKAP